MSLFGWFDVWVLILAATAVVIEATARVVWMVRRTRSARVVSEDSPCSEGREEEALRQESG